MPQIKIGRPPNFAEIVKVFPKARSLLVIFSYAPYIYTQIDRPLVTSLIAHENIHIRRQLTAGVDAWWARYLADPGFRWEEELLAHRAEYDSLASVAFTDKARRHALKVVAKKLAAPLYGRMVTLTEAMQQITKEDTHVG